MTDHDQIIAASGAGKKELQDKYVSKQLERIFKEREAVHASAGEKKYVAVIDERIQAADFCVCLLNVDHSSDPVRRRCHRSGNSVGKEEKTWRDRRKARRMCS